MRTPVLSLRFYATAAMTMVGLLFFTNWPTYQYNVLQGVAPLVYYLGSVALAGVLVLFRPKLLAVLLREPLSYWFVIYALTGLVWVVLGGDWAPDNREWRLRFLLMMLFSAGVVLSTLVDARRFANVLMIAAVIAAISFWHDFLNPFFYVPRGFPGSNPGRGAGLFINANQAGGALVIMAIAAMPFFGKYWRFLLLLVVLLGVVPTFSRASILLAIIVIGVWIWYGQFRRWGILFLLIAVPLAMKIGYELFSVGIASSEINVENIMERVAFFIEGDASDFSVNERKYVVALAWDKFAAHPLTGIGVGATDFASSAWGYPQSTHNMYLRLLAEQGLLGGVMYLSLLGLILVRGWRLVRYSADPLAKDIGVALLLVVLYFAFLGFFSHTLLREPVSVLAMAFLLTAARRVEVGSIQNKWISFGSIKRA